MDVAAHQFSGGSIDHPVPFQRGNAGEGRGRDDDVEMAAFARAGVAFVFRAVIANLEQGRMQGGFERGAQPLGARAHVDSSAPTLSDQYPRSIQNMRPAVNTNTSGMIIQVLKNTQSSRSSLRHPDVHDAQRQVEKRRDQRRSAPRGSRTETSFGKRRPS